MQSLDCFAAVYLYRDPVDMRKSIDGLSMIVLDELQLRFGEEKLFVFISRCGKRMKLLYWDKTGFALWYKRLEKQKFCWPVSQDDQVIACQTQQLQRLLCGFDVFQKPHEYLQFDTIL